MQKVDVEVKDVTTVPDADEASPSVVEETIATESKSQEEKKND